jgi:hypothetical protein
MSASQMRFEDRLAGPSNLSPWKVRMIFVLEDLELWDIIEATVPPIPVTTPILVVEFRKRNNKAKRTICDTVRDHIIPHLMGKTCAYEMWASLCKLYESSNENQKMVLHDRLRDGKLFKLLFQPLHALEVSRDMNRQLCELWHYRMAHLHHGDLGGLREVVTRVPHINIEH